MVFNPAPVFPSNGQTLQNTEIFNATIEDDASIVSQSYYLYIGDSIWVNFTATPQSDPTSTVDVIFHRPSGSPYLYQGYQFFNDWLWVRTADREGYYSIEIYNPGYPGGDPILVVGEFRHYTNTLPTGSFATPPNEGRMEGTQVISWDVTDADGDILFYRLYYAHGWTSNYYAFTTYEINNTWGGSSFEWNTSKAGVADGKYTLFLWMFDCSSYQNWEIYTGTYLNHNITIDNDNDAPSISLKSPLGGETLSGMTSVEFNASDPNEDTMTCSLYYASDGVNFDNLIVDNLTSANYSWNTSALPDGTQYAIKVVVEDEHGITSSDTSGTFTINNPEEIIFITPIEALTRISLQTVKLDVDAASAELFHNGSSKGVQTTNFEWLVQLTEGWNNLTVVAEDELGSHTSKSHMIKLDSQPPVVNILSPTAITYTNDSLTLRYTVSDGAIEVFLNGISKGALSSGSVLAGLEDGAYNLTVVATDLAGNVEKQTILFTVDTQEDGNAVAGFLLLPFIGMLTLVAWVRRRKIKIVKKRD
jgi:hypothetical protein